MYFPVLFSVCDQLGIHGHIKRVGTYYVSDDVLPDLLLYVPGHLVPGAAAAYLGYPRDLFQL